MSFQKELRLARALFQLTIYFESLRLPFTIQYLYRATYGEQWTEMPGGLWLDHLADDPGVVAGRDEFYTLYTIFRTMREAGLGLLLEVLEEETKQLGIGMGMLKPGRYRRPPREE